MKLHDRFIKQDGSKAAQFVECIDSMHVVGPASSFLDYTREWIDKVNRGSLFYVSDNAYNRFVAMEIAMQVSLIKHIKSNYQHRQTILKSSCGTVHSCCLGWCKLLCLLLHQE